MTDRHDDDVDSWLGERIDPLSPPPGTFDLIKRRARRRKYRRLAVTAGTAVVIVAAAVTVPQVVKLPVLSPSSTGAVPAGQGKTATPTPGSTHSSVAPPSASPSSVGAALGPMPPNFQPTSVTFVGTSTGWVIGQAGTPGECATAFCTSVARTDTAGKTWGGVHAPLAGAPDGASGVSQIRFLNTEDGWAFGPELFSTANGGHSWTQVSTGGLRVTDLETAGDRAFALFASCTGSGPDFAVNCTKFTLYSASAGGGAWTPAGASTTGLTDGADAEAATLALTGDRGFLLAPSGALYAGPVDGGGGAWTLVNSIISSSCPVGPVKPNANPAGALFGAVSAKELILVCSGPVGSVGASGSTGDQKLVFSSPNGGASWISMAAAPPTGIATSVAASPAESIVLATDQGIELLPAGDVTWKAAQLDGPAPAGGFSYVGMTTNLQGIALPANPASGTVWFTFDGGKSWQPSHLNGS